MIIERAVRAPDRHRADLSDLEKRLAFLVLQRTIAADPRELDKQIAEVRRRIAEGNRKRGKR